ncbi:MAG: putative N-acetylmannosamine-6-phosphate 2-epimerase [Oscillospiraceae bacterium]|jgi:N-acylglucosamine-6-phosphate 2-epimerase|nr:putative N-acetylmannosamine-6-phosphate 2-epimerase [Oscillospiraceae bacterium]
MKPVVEKLLGKTIISVQAYEDTPLYGPENMRTMAQSVLMGGADGLRACWPQDIRAIREITDKPIVGIFKDFGEGDPLDTVFITPTVDQACEVIEAGADILGVDCTIRPTRGLEELKRLLGGIRERYPDVAIMADLATLEEGVAVAGTGLVDIISSTLSGYTRQSLSRKSDRPDVELVRRLKQEVDLPVNGEGRIWELSDLEAVLEAGADMVTIGSAVTRPHEIAKRFVQCQRRWREKN